MVIRKNPSIAERIADSLLMMEPASCGGFGCAHCGTPIKRGEPMIDCADCAAVFCQKCVESGTFDMHSCAEYDFED